MHLSIPKGSNVTVFPHGVLKPPMRVNTNELMGKSLTSKTWWGEDTGFSVQDGGEETVLGTISSSGEMYYFGESHTLLCREPDSAVWQRVPIKDIDKPVLVSMPLKKLKAPDGLLDVYDLDDKGAFLAPENASAMLKLMQKAAFCGVSVSRRKAELRIDLETRRPLCFVNKLLIGSFQYNLEKTLSGLVASRVITSPRRFDSTFLEEVSKTQTVYEGACPFKDMLLMPPIQTNRKLPVVHITPDTGRELDGVELEWYWS